MPAAVDCRRNRRWLVWRIPLALTALTVFGLLAALLGAGAWRWAAWLALAVPVAVAVRYGLKRRTQ
jgi:hypothetical protein